MTVKHEIQIKSYWSELFRISCRHDYYRDGICKDLEFVPTEDTQILLKNFRLLFRKQDDGMVVLFNKDKALKLFKSPYLQTSKMSFQIFGSNPLLLHFTALPFQGAGKVYWFNNLVNQLSKDKNKLIHDSPQLDSEGKQQLPLRPPRFGHTFEKALAYKDLKIVDALGKEMPKKPLLQVMQLGKIPKSLAQQPTDIIEKTLQQEKTTSHILDLAHLPGGKYTLKATKGITDFDFYLTDKFNPNLFGMLDIYFDGPNKNYQFYDKKAITTQDYYIQMHHRSTYWKYILVRNDKNNGKSKLTDAKVSLNGKALAFTKPVPIVLNNGRKAYSIESKEAMPLLQKWTDKEKLELTLKKDSKWLSKKSFLPKPKVEMIKPDKDSGKIYSVTYFYL